MLKPKTNRELKITHFNPRATGRRVLLLPVDVHGVKKQEEPTVHTQ